MHDSKKKRHQKAKKMTKYRRAKCAFCRQGAGAILKCSVCLNRAGQTYRATTEDNRAQQNAMLS